MVNAWFNKYLGRGPSPKAVAYWTQQMRGGMAGSKVQGNILGSDDYYVANGKIDEAFIVGLFRDVAGRPTSVAEVKLWVARLHAGGGNRAAFAEDFVNKAQHGDFAPITAWNPKGGPVAANPAPAVPVAVPVFVPVVIQQQIIPQPVAPPGGLIAPAIPGK
jgi:hypothetical protein